MIAQFVIGTEVKDAIGPTAIGSGNGVGGVFRPGPKGKVALRVEGDLEVPGDTPRVVHVSKCEVAPTTCQCYVSAPGPKIPVEGFAVGFLLGFVACCLTVLALWKWASK